MNTTSITDVVRTSVPRTVPRGSEWGGTPHYVRAYHVPLAFSLAKEPYHVEAYHVEEGESVEPTDDNPHAIAPEFHSYSDSCWNEIYNHDFAYLTAPREAPTPCPWCTGRLHHHSLCNDLRASWTPTLPWGKHQGKRLAEVPTAYLRWLATKPGLSSELREAIEHHLQTTTATPQGQQFSLGPS